MLVQLSQSFFLGWIFFQPEKTRSAKLVVVRCVRRDGLLFGVHNGRHESKSTGRPGVSSCRHERVWDIFGTSHFREKWKQQKKIYLGFHDPIWRAYFSDGLVQPPTRDPCLLFYCPFFCAPKNRTLDGEICCHHTSVCFNWTGGTLEKTLGGFPWGVFWGEAGSCKVAMMAWFKFALQNSGLIKAGVLIVLILMIAGFSFTMLIVETWQKNSCCPLFQRVVVFVHSNVETLKLHIEPVRTSSLGLWATTNS